MEGAAIVAARGVGGKLVFRATGGRTGVDVCVCVEPIGDGEDDCVVLCLVMSWDFFVTEFLMLVFQLLVISSKLLKK